MAYGNSQRLGETIDPRLMQADFSGFANAGMIQGQALAQVGQDIGGILKQKSENERRIKKAEQMAKSIRDAIPELAPMAENALGELSNPDISTNQRLAIAAGIEDSLKIGVLGLERSDSEREFDFRERQFGSNLMLERDKLDASMTGGDSLMSLTPEKIDAYRAAGYDVDIVGENQDGTLVVKTAKGKGVGSGGIVPIQTENGLIFQQQPPTSYAPTPSAREGVQGGLSNKLPEPLKPFGGSFEAAGAKHGVDPNILAAIAMHETGNGTSSAFRNKNNAMGVSNEKGPVQMGSVPESIEKMARLLGQGINEGKGPYAGVKSINDIGRIYAPQGAGNDPTNLNQYWTNGVTSNLQKLTQEAEQIQTAQNLSPQSNVPQTPVPKGDVWRMDRDGLTAGRVEGSSAEIDYKLKEQELEKTKLEAKKAEAEMQKGQTAADKTAQQAASKTNFIIDKANEAEEIIRNDIASYGAGAIVDMGKSMIPGTAAYKLQKQILPALKDSIALDNLRKLKENSPTGSSGMGSLTEKEGKRLENAFGVLDVGGDKETLLKDITRLKEETFNAVHGTRTEREKGIKEGKITKDQNDQVEQMYREQILGLKEQIQPPQGLGLSPDVLNDLEEFRKRQNK